MKQKEDRIGNYIGDGSYHVNYDVFEFPEYPQIETKVNLSDTTESVYITYKNKDNYKSITVRFSQHENNAVKFGDQLDGNFASKNEILYHLGLMKREFIPKKRLLIEFRAVAKKTLGEYEKSDLTIKEMYALGENADLSKYKGKIAKDSNYLILGDRVEVIEETKRNILGQNVVIGDFVYMPMSEAKEDIINNNELTGGKADNMTIEQIAEKHNVSIDFLSEQLNKGISVEREHTDDLEKQKEIALDHLFESPNYYIELEKMEEKLKNEEIINNLDNTEKELYELYKLALDNHKNINNKITKNEVISVIWMYFNDVVVYDTDKLSKYFEMQEEANVNMEFELSEDTELRKKFLESLKKNIWDYIPEKEYEVSKIKKLNFKPSPDDENLKKIISHFPTSDVLRPLMTTVHFDEKGIIATDGFKLLFIKSKVEKQGNYCMTKACSNNYGFDLIEGNYPHYETIIPYGFSGQYDINAYGLLSFIKGIEYARWQNSITELIVLKFNDVFYGLNSSFLSYVLKSMLMLGHEELSVLINDPTRAIIFTPKDKTNPSSFEFDFALLMPMKINDKDLKGYLIYDVEEQCVYTEGIQDKTCLNPHFIEKNNLHKKINDFSDKFELISAENETLKNEVSNLKQKEQERDEKIKVENERKDKIQMYNDKIDVYQEMMKATKDKNEKIIYQDKIEVYKEMLNSL